MSDWDHLHEQWEALCEQLRLFGEVTLPDYLDTNPSGVDILSVLYMLRRQLPHWLERMEGPSWPPSRRGSCSED